VNGEPQKKAEEITAEVAIALTLSQLHPESGGLDSLSGAVSWLLSAVLNRMAYSQV